MKTKIIIAAIILVTSLKAQDTLSNVTGPHGGLVKVAENYKIEVNKSSDCIICYLYDNALKLVPNKFSTGSVMFFWDNNVSANKYLIPLGSEGFSVDVPNANYDYLVLRFKISEKYIQVRFENSQGIVKKESSKTELKD